MMKSTLLALVACSLMAPAMGASSNSADDLTALSRMHAAERAEAVVHYMPEEAVLVADDMELSGVWVVKSFEIAGGAIVIAPTDLTIIAEQSIAIDGQLLGAHSADGGVSLTLKACGPMFVRGLVEAGSGIDGADGGELFSASARLELDGNMIAGSGAHSIDTRPGGDGGKVVHIGVVTDRSRANDSAFRAGHGGNGLHGSDGGAGGSSALLRGSETALLEHLTTPSLLRSTSFALATARRFPELARDGSFGVMGFGFQDPEEGEVVDGCTILGAGDWGTDGTGSPAGPSLGTASPPVAYCMDGNDGSNGASSIAGNGGDGGDGDSATASTGQTGGDGGDGGLGGSAWGNHGQHGSDATDCCGLIGTGEGEETGKKGGNGGNGGVATAGTGGIGGTGGAGSADCWDGFHGSGGRGGDLTKGSGGNGGKGGKGLSAGGQGGDLGAPSPNGYWLQVPSGNWVWITAEGEGGANGGGAGGTGPGGGVVPGSLGNNGADGGVC